MKTGKDLYNKKRFRKSLWHFLLGRTAQAVATVVFTVMAVRLMEPLEYGAYMVLWGVIELARPLSSLGLLPALQQYLPELAVTGTRAQLQSFVRWTTAGRFALLGLFAALMLMFWEPLSAWLGFPPQPPHHVWLACAMVITVLGAQFTEQMLESLLEQRVAGMIRALLPLGRLAGLLALASAGHATLMNMLVVDLVTSAVCLLLSEIWLVRQLRQVHPDGSKHFERSEILGFIWNMSFAQLLNSVANAGTLRLLVSRLLGVEVAGQFAFFQQLMTQAKRFLPSMLLANLVRPMLISRHIAGDTAIVATAAGVLWKSNLLLIWPVVMALAVSGDWLLSVVTGGRISQGGIAMAWMMLGAASFAQGQIISMLMQVYRHSAMVRTNSLISLTAPLLVWAGASWGLAGVAAGLTASLWLRTTTGLFQFKRQGLAISIDWPGAARVALALAAATAVGFVAARHVGPAAGLAAMAAVYGVAVLLSRPLGAQEFDLLGKTLGKRARHLRRLARPA